MFPAFTLADSGDFSDKEESFQAEQECSWNGSSKTQVNRNTQQHITDTEKQSRFTTEDTFVCHGGDFFSQPGINIEFSMFV